MVQWYAASTPDEQQRLARAWAGAPLVNLELTEILLDVAKGDVLAYAPAPDNAASAVAVVLEVFGLADKLTDVLAVLDLDNAAADPPTRYVLAQLQQAKNLWEAGRASGDGDIGPEGFQFTPRPLDRTTRQTIRPMDGKPSVL